MPDHKSHQPAYRHYKPKNLAVVRIDGRDVYTSGKVWVFVPESHKMEHHGRERPIYIGPKAQAVLGPWPRPELSAYLFSSREAMEEQRAGRRAARRTPLTPSQRARRRKAKPRGPPARATCRTPVK